MEALNTAKPGAVATALLRHLSVGRCMTIDQIAGHFGIRRTQAAAAASCLLRRDYLMKMSHGCFALTDAGMGAAASGKAITSGPKGKTGVIPRQKDTFRQRAWTSMRFNGRFTIGQIVRAAARADDKNARENARKYVAQLRRAGFVKELPKRAPGTALNSNGFKRFMLVRNTGRLAPVYRQELQAMHDFNTGEDVPCTPR